jgi:diguanylate cyclase (GGDEF)-like protein
MEMIQEHHNEVQRLNYHRLTIRQERRHKTAPHKPIHFVAIERFGVIGTMILIMIGAFITAMIVMWPINLLTNGSLFTGFVVSAFLCTIVLPYPVYFTLQVIYELERTCQELLRVSITDPLTGAYNRRYFITCLETACKEALLNHQWPSVILFDIDSFKSINDTYGHIAGDRVLQQITQLCQSNSRHGDIFARYGGEEFAFLLPNTTQAEAVLVAERIRQLIFDQTISYDHASITCTVSIGVATFEAETTPDKLLIAADMALYQAKNSGKNQIVVNPSISQLPIHSISRHPGHSPTEHH